MPAEVDQTRRRTRVRQLPARGGERSFVLVHGIGTSAAVFRPLSRALSTHGDVFALDLPGFGGTPRPTRPLSVSDFADDVAGALTALRLDDPVLLGHSLGAQIVAELLAREPRWASTAVLVGPTVDPAAPTAWQQGLRLVRSTRHDSWAVRGAALRAYAVAGPRWYAQTVPGMLGHDLPSVLPRVVARTLVVRGDQDAVTTQAWSEEVTRLLPDGRLEVLPGGAHGVVWDSATDLAERVAHHAGAGTRP